MNAVREALSAAQRSAMHLEMRDVYAVDSERDALESWRGGFRHDPADRASWWTSWHDTVRATVDRGVVMRRARIVSEPVTEYIHYEHSGTFMNVAAGELVRWLPRRQATDLLVPPVDLWVVDESTVVFNHFTGDGNWADPSMEVVHDAALGKQVSGAFDAVWQRAIPHEEYQPG